MHKRRTEESKQIHEPDSDHHDPDSGSRGKQVPASGAEEDTAQHRRQQRKCRRIEPFGAERGGRT